jgi:hypothetical protein
LKFFETIKSLFPISRAFQFIIHKNKRKFIKGITILPETIRREMELVYFDIFPDTTRFPKKWEKTFATIILNDELTKRRSILDSLWKINVGGQSVSHLEIVLQGIDSNIRVIENVPICNPKMIYIVDTAVCDNQKMVCDNTVAVCDYYLGEREKIIKAVCDNNKMICDYIDAVCDYYIMNDGYTPSIIRNNIENYDCIPDNQNYWGMYFFICKSVLRDSEGNILFAEMLKINKIWKNYIEYLILKIKPVHSIGIIFIRWMEE